MPLAPVVVEIAPPDSPPDLRAALIDACSRAAREVRCAETSEGADDAGAQVIAIVSWRDGTNVRLEVALRAEKQWVVRQIGFDPRDPPGERWRAVGLVIGTLATVIARRLPASAELAPVPEAPAAPPPAPPAPPATPKARAPVASKQERTFRAATRARASARAVSPRVRVAVSGVFGPGLEDGPARAGAELGARAFVGVRWLHVSGAVSYTRSLRDTQSVRSEWMDAWLGLASIVDLGEHFEAAFEMDALGERFASSLGEAGTSGKTDGSRLRGGFRLGTDVATWALDPIGFFVGAAGAFASARTEVRVDGEAVATAPAISFAARAGVVVGFR